MSQLSSGGRKNRAKQSKGAKNTLCFLIIFAVICIGITTACIYNTLNLRDDSVIELGNLSNKKQEDVEKMDVNKKYLTNGIETEEITFSEGNIIQTFDVGDPLFQYNIYYEKISGLKDTDIQDKINEDIKNVVEKCKNILNEKPEFERIDIGVSVTGNFSDVLSAHCYYSLIGPENNEIEMYSIGLNYRLDTGEKLKFTDLFWEDASIKAILSNAIYEKYAWNYAFESGDGYMDLDQIDYGEIENRTFKKVAKFNSNPDINFYFSPKMIWATIGDLEFPIELSKISKDITLYTKFVSEDLYTDESLKKEFYAFTDAFLIDQFEIEDMRGDNFYYEIMTYATSDVVNVDVKEEVQKKIDGKLQHYYEIATQNPDKAYLVSVIYIYDTSENSSEKFYQYNGYVCETDLDYFKNHKNQIISNARSIEQGEVWCFDFSATDENVEFYEQFSAHTADYTTGEIEENVYTKEDREAEQMAYEQT